MISDAIRRTPYRSLSDLPDLRLSPFTEPLLTIAACDRHQDQMAADFLRDLYKAGTLHKDAPSGTSWFIISPDTKLPYHGHRISIQRDPKTRSALIVFADFSALVGRWHYGTAKHTFLPIVFELAPSLREETSNRLWSVERRKRGFFCRRSLSVVWPGGVSPASDERQKSYNRALHDQVDAYLESGLDRSFDTNLSKSSELSAWRHGILALPAWFDASPLNSDDQDRLERVLRRVAQVYASFNRAELFASSDWAEINLKGSGKIVLHAGASRRPLSKASHPELRRRTEESASAIFEALAAEDPNLAGLRNVLSCMDSDAYLSTTTFSNDDLSQSAHETMALEEMVVSLAASRPEGLLFPSGEEIRA